MSIGLPALPFRSAPECIISVGGEELSALYPYLAEVRVEHSRRDAAAARIRFESPPDAKGWVVPDATTLRPWAAVVIEVVLGGTRSELLRGYVREIQVEYAAGGRVSVSIECQDESLALDRTHERVVWGADVPADDATILATIAAKHGLTCDPMNGPGLSGLVLHQDSTDIRFLRERAEINGYELILYGRSVYFGPMRLDAGAQPDVVVDASGNCTRFVVRADGHRPDQVGYDLGAAQGVGTTRYVVGANLALLGNEAGDSTGAGLQPFTWLLSRESAASAAELAALAQAKANEASMRISADGEIDGTLYGHILQIGLPVGVTGIGQRFGGSYYVDRVIHVLTNSSYRQECQLLRNAFGDNLGAQLPGPLAGVL